jgi:hypothetical protein
MGIPLCLLVFGPSSLPAAVIATLFTACVLFLVAIVIIEVDLHGSRSRSRWRTARGVSIALSRNPLLLAPLAGIAVGLSGLSLPDPVERFASLLGGRGLADRVGLHWPVLGAGARRQQRCGLDRRAGRTQIGVSVCGDRAASVLRVAGAATLVALGGSAQRLTDRVRAVHHRQVVWDQPGPHLRRDPGLASGLGREVLVAYLG